MRRPNILLGRYCSFGIGQWPAFANNDGSSPERRFRPDPIHGEHSSASDLCAGPGRSQLLRSGIATVLTGSGNGGVRQRSTEIINQAAGSKPKVTSRG